MDTLTMGAIRKTSTADAVFQILHDRIVSGDLKPGDKLPSQSDLAVQLSVSRNTVREAIHKLSAMGLLAGKPGVGTTVQVSTPARYVGSLSAHLLLDSATVREFLETRLFMETASVRLAVLRASADDIAALRDLIEKQKAASDEGNVDQFNDLDAEFHVKLAKFGKNEVLVKVLETVRDMLHRFISEVNTLPDAITKAIQYHTKITDFIADRDIVGAEKTMVKHLRSVVDIVQTNLQTDLNLETFFDMELGCVSNAIGRATPKKK